MDVTPGGISALAIQDQGHLFVAPAYYQVTGDAAVQLNAAADWAAQKIVPECDFKLTDFAWYVTAVGTQGNATIELYSHDAANDQPNASLATLVSASDCGASADAWVQEELSTGQQLYAGKEYWIVIKGAASKDFSVSARRWNTAQGSMFPDSMPKAMSTDDSGSTWTAITQDSKPAILNIILNPNEDGVPQLAYGRADGKYVVTTNGLGTIPIEATFLDVSGDTADTLYYVYMDTDGTIETSTTTWTKSNGLMVMTGATGKKLVGMYYAIDVLGGGDQAPVDVMDRRLIAYPNRSVSFGKFCPYASATSKTYDSGTSWVEDSPTSGDYKIEAIFMNRDRIQLLNDKLSTRYAGFAFGVNATNSPDERSNFGYSGALASPSFIHVSLLKDMNAGYAYIVPLIKRSTSGNNPQVQYWAESVDAGYSEHIKSSILGTIKSNV